MFIGADRKLEVFTKYYAKLSEVVPFKEWSHHFVSAGIITNEDNRIIQNTVQLPSQISSRVLDRVYQSLKLGMMTDMFDKLLSIMEQHGNTSCVELANQIRGRPSSGTISVKCAVVILFYLVNTNFQLTDIHAMLNYIVLCVGGPKCTADTVI